MFENIQSLLRDQCRLNKKQPVIAGISGGPDSLCLLSILRESGYPDAHPRYPSGPGSGRAAMVDVR